MQFSCTTPTKTKEEPIQEKPMGNTQSELFSFWDGFDFQDQASITDPDQAEQRLVDFLARFPKYSLEQVEEALQMLFAQASKNPIVWDYFEEKLASYLYHPNSPMYNEIYYEAVLKVLLKDESLSSAQQQKFSALLKLVQLNKPGQAVSDFTYYTGDIAEHKFSDSKGSLRVLFFYDLTCSHCAEEIATLAQLPVLNQWIDQQKIKLIAIEPLSTYADWHAHRTKIPANWINGIDKKQNIIKKQLFNLRAYPSLYLIDPADKVILRDATAEQIIAQLAQLL